MDDRRRIELEDLYDPEPDDELIAIARDEAREAGDSWSRQPVSPRCPRCGWRNDHPVCPSCGRPMREPRSEVEVRWLRNNGFPVPSGAGARVEEKEES